MFAGGGCGWGFVVTGTFPDEGGEVTGLVVGGGIPIGVVVAGLLTGTGVLAGFVGGKDTGVVEGTVTGTPAGLEGEIVTGFVAGTVMMVGVSGGVIIGVDDAGFVGKTTFVGLVVSSRLLLLWDLLSISLRDTGNSSSSSLLSSLLVKSSVPCTSAYNAAILFVT